MMRQLAETLEINLVLIMRTEDYYRCAINNGSLKSNSKFLTNINNSAICKVTEVLGPPLSAKDK